MGQDVRLDAITQRPEGWRGLKGFFEETFGTVLHMDKTLL